MSQISATLKKEIRAFVHEALDEETMELVRCATQDLYEGASAISYRGFSDAVRRIQNALDNVGISDLWVDEDGFVSIHAPEVDIKAYHYSRRIVLSAAFGELADYL